MKSLLLFFLCVFSTEAAWPAACCGGSVTFPGLITTGEPLKFNFAMNSATIIGDAPAKGVPIFRKDEDQSTRQFFSGASTYRHDRSQYSVAGSYYDQKGGSGDLGIGYAYNFEVSPDAFTGFPDIYALILVSAPTGRSIYEIKEADIETVTGKGLWSYGAGLHLIGRKFRWDYSVSPMLTAHASRKLEQTRVSQEPSANCTFAGGYSITGQYRLGLTLTPFYEGAKTVSGTRGQSSLVWPVGFQFSAFPAVKWGWTLAYTDETLVGPVRNTTLSRSVSLSTIFRDFAAF